MLKKDLQNILKDNKIKGYSRMNKTQLKQYIKEKLNIDVDEDKKKKKINNCIEENIPLIMPEIINQALKYAKVKKGVEGLRERARAKGKKIGEKVKMGSLKQKQAEEKPPDKDLSVIQKLIKQYTEERARDNRRSKLQDERFYKLQESMKQKMRKQPEEENIELDIEPFNFFEGEKYYLFISNKDPILINSDMDKKEVLNIKNLLKEDLFHKKKYILIELTKMTKSDIEKDKKHSIKTIYGDTKINIIQYEYNKTKNKLQVSNKKGAILWSNLNYIDLELLKDFCLSYINNKLKTNLYDVNRI